MIPYIYSTPEEVARAVAEEAFVRPSQEGWVHIALSGGSTPRLLFSLLRNPYVVPSAGTVFTSIGWMSGVCHPQTRIATMA